MYTNRNLIYRLPSLTHRTSPYPIVNYPKDNFLGCYKYTSIFQSLRNIFKHLHPSSESKSNFKQVAQTLNKKKKKKERVLFPFLSDRCLRKERKKYFIACIRNFIKLKEEKKTVANVVIKGKENKRINVLCIKCSNDN